MYVFGLLTRTLTQLNKPARSPNSPYTPTITSLTQPRAEGTRMAHTTALLDGARLVRPEHDASLIPLDTPAWLAWLEHATTFACPGPSGRFTVRKERQARGGERYCA